MFTIEDKKSKDVVENYLRIENKSTNSQQRENIE